MEYSGFSRHIRKAVQPWQFQMAPSQWAETSFKPTQRPDLSTQVGLLRFPVQQQPATGSGIGRKYADSAVLDPSRCTDGPLHQLSVVPPLRWSNRSRKMAQGPPTRFLQVELPPSHPGTTSVPLVHRATSDPLTLAIASLHPPPQLSPSCQHLSATEPLVRVRLI